MPYRNGNYEPDRGEAYANATNGLHGEEMDGRYEELAEVENGVRKHWADKLREEIEYTEDETARETLRHAASLLDPYSGNDLGDRFARTEYTGEGWLKP